MNIPETNMFEFAEETVRDRYKTVQSSLMPDGLVGESNLPIVFVSTKEVETWHRDTGEWVSIAGYNIKKTAQTLAENNPDLVVFYDPVAGSVDYSKLWDLEQNEGESEEDYISRWEAAANEASQAARDESERLLRLQVEAFVDWLWSVG
ncbi:MAG: hypothetical protein LBH28_00265, partial [Oscillospiraceae bacterium]|jgi:hypothetical protein|nr:hypothetical protein [Oscillospiraceae bacterium]